MAIALLWGIPVNVAAQPAPLPPVEKAAIVLDGRELFVVRDLEDFSARDRADFINQVLATQVNNTPLDETIHIQAVSDDNGLTIRVGDRHLLTLTEADLIGGISAPEQADFWITTLKNALKTAQWQRTEPYRQKVTVQIIWMVAGVALLQILLRSFRRQLRRRRTQSQGWYLVWGEVLFGILPWLLWFNLGYWILGAFPTLRRHRYQTLIFIRQSLTADLISVGNASYSVLELGKILALIFGLWLGVKGFTRVIRLRLLQSVGIRREMRDAIALLIQITLTTVGLLIVLQAVGVDVSSLAILVSVVGVGIGFGLQNIANNLISGLIIMLERPVQVGDFVKLGDLTGTVERIGLRSTEISTIDRLTIIVPNSEFIDNKVVNWSHGHPVSRLHIPFGVAYGSPLQQMRNTVLESANRHPQVLRYPKPQVWFKGFGDSSLDFDLLVWVREPRLQFRIQSDLYYLIETNFRRHGIEIPFPQRDVNLRPATIAAIAQQIARAQTGNTDPPPSPSATPDLDTVLDWCELLSPQEQPSDAEIHELVTLMRGENGLDIRDRRFGLQLHPRCFVGSEMVQWFLHQQLASREEAIKLGQILIEQGIMHHVNDEHSFKDAYLFYRFFDDES
jgi:small-conductance mechanosensitive channel